MLTRRVFLITCFFGLIAACQQQGSVPAATTPAAGSGQVKPTHCGSIRQKRRDIS